MKYIPYETLIDFHREILAKAGLDSETNEAVTKGLCETSLRGVDSHGIRYFLIILDQRFQDVKTQNQTTVSRKNFLHSELSMRTTHLVMLLVLKLLGTQCVWQKNLELELWL